MTTWRKFNARERRAREESCLPGPTRLDACLVLPPGPAASLAVGGLHFAGGLQSLSCAFTFNCCSGLGGAAGFGPQAQRSVLAHLCSHQQGLAFHQVASGDVAARGSGAPCLCPAARLGLGSHSWSSSTQMVLRCSSTILSLRTRSSSSTLLHISASTVA